MLGFARNGEKQCSSQFYYRNQSMRNDVMTVLAMRGTFIRTILIVQHAKQSCATVYPVRCRRIRQNVYCHHVIGGVPSRGKHSATRRGLVKRGHVHWIIGLLRLINRDKLHNWNGIVKGLRQRLAQLFLVPVPARTLKEHAVHQDTIRRPRRKLHGITNQISASRQLTSIQVSKRTRT